jgi:class 3 adenylate cyclase/tetratricopeptide (TPR) repeat protein
MLCPECQTENRAGRAFCSQCGALLSVTCGACGSVHAAADRFCGLCGRRLRSSAGAARVLGERAVSPPRELAEKALRSQPVLEGQHRLVTVLVADMADYTSLAERLCDDELYPLMQRVFERMIATVHEHEGTVQDLAGDGLMALFGAPVALEDAPLCACRAALGIQARMRELSGEVEARYASALRIRIGIHTGPVVVGKIGDDLRMEFKALGDTVNLAARLEAAAEPGGVVLSEATQRLVEGYVESEFLGEHTLKGKSEPQRLYRLGGLRAGVTRFDVSLQRGLTRLVGRDAELEILERSWEEARAGRRQIVNLVGEAGIGKSRLLHELRGRLEGQNFFFLQGHCPAHRHGAFLPFIEVVRTFFGISEGDRRSETERKLRSGLQILGIDADETLPYLLNLLGIEVAGREFRKEDSEVVGVRTRRTLQRLLLERCRMSPVVLYVEDLHWVDAPSEELLSWVAEGEEGLPLLVVCAYRPQYRPPWLSARQVGELRLQPLSRHNALDLLRHRFSVEDLPGELERLVLEKTEGNPLFVEEVANYLVEKGSVQRVEEGIRFEAEAGRDALPATLQNLLMERVDRLDEGSRGVLQAAAVVGRRFPADVVSRACRLTSEAVAERMRDLERQELVFPDTGRGEFLFKHALIQDAVYDSLLETQRKELHERVAEAIEELRADRLGEVAEALARHYGKTTRAEKAAHYMALAGEKSLRVYSLDEALLRFRQVVELREAVPECANDAFLTDVILSLARIHYFRADFASQIALAERHLPMVEALGDPRRLSRLLFEIGYGNVFSGTPEVGRPLFQRALAIGEEIEDDESICYACLGLAWDLVWWGRPVEETRRAIRQLADRALEIATRLGDVWVASKVHLGVSTSSMFGGRPAESRRASLRLLELSRETGDPRPRAMGLWSLAFNNAFTLNPEEAIQNADESLRISLSPLDRQTASAAKCLALALLERGEEALALVRALRPTLAAGHFATVIQVIDMVEGAALVSTGYISGGLRKLDEASRRLSDQGFFVASCACQLILGEIYLRIALLEDLPPLSVLLRNAPFLIRTFPFASRRARAHLEQAAAEFRSLEAPSFVAWCLYDLGVLHRGKGRPDEARRCFAEAQSIAREVGADVLEARAAEALKE